MIYKAILLFLISSFGFSQTKKQLHEKAGKEFLNTHFFENGRGMMLSPDLIKFISAFQKLNIKNVSEKIFQDRYGFNLLDGKIVGLFDVKYKHLNVGVLGCTACHSGKAAGIFIPGLGNKTIDPYLIGKDTHLIQKVWGLQGRTDEFKRLHKTAMNFAKVSSDKKVSNQTRGLVPDATIQTFFYKDLGMKYPDLPNGEVKVPHLWGLKEKRKTGIFTSGEFSGESVGWEFGAELFGSDSGDHMRAVLPKLEHVVENIFHNFLPPKYPFEINRIKVKRGKELFKKNCQQCHGDHERDLEGYPIYQQPKLIKHSKVMTDSDRLKGMSEFIQLVEKSSVSDILKMNYRKDSGYIAPNLWGIWSRFPYLHNGSVPTLYDLFKDPKERPNVFSMFQAGEKHRFDEKNLGLTLPKNLSIALRKAKKGNRNYYFTKRTGHSNQGHYFKFMNEYSDDDRYSIIEYLKTL